MELLFGILSVLLSFILCVDARKDLYRCPKTVHSLGRSYSVMAFRDKCYVFASFERTWIDANAQCRRWGGQLVSIPNMATQDFIITALSDLSWRVNGVWIGANSRHGNWKWASGDTVRFSYWHPGQPSKTLGFSFEDCALMRRSDGWRWHDYHCDSGFFYKYRFICDYTIKNSHGDPALKTADEKESTSNSSSGLLIGFICGGAVILICCIFAFVFCRKRFRRNKNKEEMSARFVNLSYAQVNERDSIPRATNNIYMDTTNMHRLYNSVNKDVNHGVNQFGATASCSATSCESGMDCGKSKDACDGYETPVKSAASCVQNRPQMPLPPTQHVMNNQRSQPAHEGQYEDMTGTSCVKDTNVKFAASRIIDPSKPSNLQHDMSPNTQPVYMNDDNAQNEQRELQSHLSSSQDSFNDPHEDEAHLLERDPVYEVVH